MDGGPPKSGAQLEEYRVYKVEYPRGESYAKGVQQLKNPDAFYLLDPSERIYEYPLVSARSIVASSPDEELFKEYGKEGSQSFFMPMYTLEEVKRVVKADALGPLDEATAIERFDKVGGNIRAILKGHLFEKTLVNIRGKVDVSLRIRDVLMAASNRNQMLLDKNSVCSSTLYCYNSKYPFEISQTTVGFVSSFVRYELCFRYYKDLYNQGRDSSSVWESVCAIALTLGGSFEIRHLPYPGQLDQDAKSAFSGSLEVPRIPNAPRRVSDLKAVWAGLPLRAAAQGSRKCDTVYESVNPKFPLVDLVMYRDVVFNPTLAVKKKEQPTLATMKKLLVAVHATPEHPVHLFHCVPADHYESFTLPTPNESVWSELNANNQEAHANEVFVRSRLAQYVLCIPNSLPESNLSQSSASSLPGSNPSQSSASSLSESNLSQSSASSLPGSKPSQSSASNLSESKPSSPRRRRNKKV
jgi:hypothetical protein